MNRRRSIRIALRILLILGILIALLALAVGVGVEWYLNHDDRRDLAKFLPINGTCTYEKVTFHPFKDLPHVSLRMHDVVLTDSTGSNNPPLQLEELEVRVSVADWKKKEIAIEDIALKGLNIHLYEDENGYSNIANLIKRTTPKKAKNNTDKKSGISIVSHQSKLTISDINLSKINTRTSQSAHSHIEKIRLENKEINNAYHINLDIDNVAAGAKPLNSSAEPPIHFDNVETLVELATNQSSLLLKKIAIQGGHLELLTDTTTGKSLFQQLFGTGQTNRSQKPNKKADMQIGADGAEVIINDIDFAQIDPTKNKHLAAKINALTTTLHTESDTSAAIALDLSVDQLGFNTTKGAYLSDSDIKGTIDAQLQHGKLTLASPSLTINEDLFDVAAVLHFDGKTPTTLSINKPNAETQKIRPLLTDKIQQSIATYDVEGPFDASAKVVFTPGKKDPHVEVNLHIDNNRIHVKGHELKNGRAHVTFINRLHDDARQFQEDKRNARVIVHHVTGNYDGFDLDAQQAIITSSPAFGDRIQAKANITGKAASASKFLNHDNFYFQDGQFTIATEINGSLNKIDDLIAGTNLSLDMKDLNVLYPKSETVFPFDLLTLEKNGATTTFHIVGRTKEKNRDFHIRGDIDRVESLIFPERNSQLSTEANIRASSISWEGIVALFGDEGVFSNKNKERKAKRSMKQTLSGIQESFSPVVNVVIDTIYYGKDIQLLDFVTGVHFDNKSTLVLEETTFSLDKSRINLDGQVFINTLDFTKFDFDIKLERMNLESLLPKFDYFDIKLLRQIPAQPDNMSMDIQIKGELDDTDGLKPETLQTFMTYEGHGEEGFTGALSLIAKPATKKIDVTFMHAGHPKNINYLLDSDEYYFDKGQYKVTFRFDDNLESIPQMIEESKIKLTIKDAEVNVKEMDVSFPLTDIRLKSKDNNATYKLFLRSDSLDEQITLDGRITNIRHFLFHDTKTPYDVELKIASPRLVWKDFLGIFKTKKSDKKKKSNGKAMKESLSKILYDFNPNITLDIDRLEYSDKFTFENIFGKAYLDGDKLKIHEADVAYGDSRVQVNAEAVLSKDEILPFDLDVKLSNINIADVLEHHQYFDNEELREADTLDGNIWLDLDLSSEINFVDNGFNTEKTRATMDIRLEDLVIAGLQTIDTIASKIGREKRFQDIRFAPITSRINIIEDRIEIPLTEIQSNAIHVFVQGAIDRKSSENLWISVPLSNLKKPDLETIPDTTGYAAAGKKIYLQMISSLDEDHGKMKVHLRKKKYFQERFQAGEFRAYKRRMRKESRRIRKMKSD